MSDESDDLRQRVTAWRTRRGLSIRRAATLGGISNETWGRYEETGKLTPTIRSAVASAFGWPADWPENPPVEDETDPLKLGPDTRKMLDKLTELSGLIARLADSGQQVDQRLDEAERLLTQLEAAIGELERRVAQFEEGNPGSARSGRRPRRR